MFHLLHLGISGFFLVLNILVGIWVYNDAQKRGMDNSVIWLLGSIFCCPIVPIIYLIVRK